ncbi:MAG: TIGR03960 family B12-binding radical SAM protein [Candidatus Omnitrophica bacterium]|nr:TIGR03960 family B12-binding radical SAM protein [Candidatus Omnitrophota bacterium]
MDELFSQVMKPGRYIGAEWHLPKKDFNGSSVKFALCFPDLYEVGMSNIGIRIIYGLLNKEPDVVCERFFSLAQDAENILRSAKREIFSLESKRPLREFDIAGFSLGYELSYTNVLNILDLGGVPLLSKDRSNSDPIVIAGGPASINPEPMHEFFDLFVIGEAEEVILEIIAAFRPLKAQLKQGKIIREEVLLQLSRIEGVYVPLFYDAAYGPDLSLVNFSPNRQGVPQKINKRFIADLDLSYYPVEWLVPYIQIIHDRISVEIMRGCPNKCRFCQAHNQYSPLRFRKKENVLKLAEALYKNTGYEDISLAGLSVTDYPCIAELLVSLISEFKPKGVGVSLPSIKPKDMVGNMSELIATIKKTGLTFAPEAATKRLRNILNKDFSEDDFNNAAQAAFKAGYQHLKLYFMIGLPSERQEDLDAIFEFSNNLSMLRKSIAQRSAQINISINTLIPKPHTPFQWLAMEPIESIAHKHEYLKRISSRNKKLKLSLHNLEISLLEAILSRGDRKLSQVILAAYKLGARFDAWDNSFNFNIWKKAFSESNIDPQDYLKVKGRDVLLPWDFIEVGAPKENLLAEYEKTVALQ